MRDHADSHRTATGAIVRDSLHLECCGLVLVPTDEGQPLDLDCPRCGTRQIVLPFGASPPEG